MEEMRPIKKSQKEKRKTSFKKLECSKLVISFTP
jgi:hypothetical protein